jgi:hypothetical protein
VAVLFVAVACVWLAVVAYRTWGGNLPEPLNWSFSAPSSDGRMTAPVASADAEDAETRSIRSSFVDTFDPERAELPKFPPPPQAPPAVEQSPENQARIDDAAAKRAAASASRDAFLDTVEDETTKRKARVYSDAAIAGVAAKHVEADITAADEHEACAQFFAKLHVDPSTASCEVSRAVVDEGGKSYVQDLEPEEAKMAKSDVEEANMEAVEEEEEKEASSSEPTPAKAAKAKAAPPAPAKASVAQRQKDRELEDAKKELARLKKQLEEKEAHEHDHAEMDAYEDELAHQAKQAAAAADDGEVDSKDDTQSYEDALRTAEIIGLGPRDALGRPPHDEGEAGHGGGDGGAEAGPLLRRRG